MTISYNWLKDYINIDLPVARVGELLTDTGLEVEGIEKVESIQGGLEGIVIGEVLSCEKHPNADRLKVTRVDIGSGDPLHIVCGAPNVAVGQKVPVATIGSTLFPANGESFQIKKGKIRGEVSEGMICAEDELGLGEGHDGIMVLEESTAVGTTGRQYFNVETDFAIEIGLTPNRTDAMSHYGVARDLRAALVQQGVASDLHLPAVDFKIDNTHRTIPVSVENTEACPQYLGVTISHVRIDQSPMWLQNRLRTIGLKPINNVVDATNYVLHEIGHPLHAFDADEISGEEVIVKNMPTNTVFTTLDDLDRKLDQEDLMICNAQEGMCIAGVFGGTKSGVTEKTKSIFLESAWFNPVAIRKTAKRHTLNTDASYRYERGVDPNMTRYALKRAAMLIKELTGGEISSEIQEAISKEFKPIEVKLRHAYLNSLVGNAIEKDKVEEVLQSLEIEILERNETGWLLSIPTYRADVTREADVVEEFLRIYGFNNVTLPAHMQLAITEKTLDNEADYRKKSTSFLSANGYAEMMNNSLTKLSYYTDLVPDQENRLVRILNPLSNDLSVMRQNLLFGGLEVVAHNINRQESDICIFEFGKVYFREDAGSYREDEHLMLILSGKDGRENWMHQPGNASFFQLKGMVTALLKRLGISEWQEELADHSLLEANLMMRKGEKILVEIGPVAHKLAGYFDIEQEVFVATLNWTNVVKHASKQKVSFNDLPRFPHVRRDLALLVDHHVQYEAMQTAARKAGGKLLQHVNLFDVYTGKSLPQGKKSYAMSFVLQDPNQTLTDKRVDATMQKITATLKKQFAAELR
jgi:phenylalanyl-tRNA synthetase beta chain